MLAYERYKTYNGKSLSDWSKETGIKVGTLSFRLKKGWTLEKAVSTPVLTHSQASRKHYILGEMFTDRFGNKFVVEQQVENSSSGTPMYKVRFVESGYETTATASQIMGQNHGHVQDRLSPSVHGVGIMGLAYGKDDPKLFDVWRSMIARCYNTKNPRYKTYGAKGITVCDRWKRFDYFLEDAKRLPGYNKELLEKGVISLDKDTIDRKQLLYGPETCCFITKSENTKEALKRRWHEKEV